jgi:SAM-dependent methyltransferase
METLEEVNREGRERLHPSLTNPSWLVLRERRRLFQGWMSELGSGQLSVLDVGGRIQPYRVLFAGRLRKYVAVDLRQSPLVDVVSRAEQLPLASGQFDLVICTQVLEYVAEPAVVIAEMHRVLKSGGHLFLSVPAVFPRDSENDAWRFLPRSLHILLKSFRHVETAPEGGSISGLFRSICVFLIMFGRPALVRQILRFSAVPVLNLAAVVLERASGKLNDQFAANLSVFAEK